MALGLCHLKTHLKRHDSEKFDETSLGNDVLPLEREEMDYEDVLDGVFDHDDQPETQLLAANSNSSTSDLSQQHAGEASAKSFPEGQSSIEPPAKKRRGRVKGAKEWTEQEKNCFLIVVKGKYSLLKQVSKKNPIWQAIAHKMLAMGYDRQPEACKSMWKAFGLEYKACKHQNKKSGSKHMHDYATAANY